MAKTKRDDDRLEELERQVEKVGELERRAVAAELELASAGRRLEAAGAAFRRATDELVGVAELARRARERLTVEADREVVSTPLRGRSRP